MYNEIRQYIRKHTPEAALYEQIAEEAVELAHAAMKYARAIRGESPTPVNLGKVQEQMREEYSDVYIAAQTAGVAVEPSVVELKYIRWFERLRAQEAAK